MGKDSVIKQSTLERLVKQHSAATRIGPDTLNHLQDVLDEVVQRFVEEVGEEATRQGQTTILPRHVDAVRAGFMGGASTPPQLVDSIDHLSTEDLAALVNLVKERLEEKQKADPAPVQPQPPAPAPTKKTAPSTKKKIAPAPAETPAHAPTKKTAPSNKKKSPPSTQKTAARHASQRSHKKKKKKRP